MMESQVLRTAAESMRKAHGPEHKRHYMWVAMASACEVAADQWDWNTRYDKFPTLEMQGLYRVASEYLKADPS